VTWTAVQDLWPLLALATAAGVWTMRDIARSTRPSSTTVDESR